jgi:uroporphyrinogen-III decarboxylase
MEFDWTLAGLSDGEARTDVDKMVDAIISAVQRFDYDWAMVFPDDYIEFEPLGLKMRDGDYLPAIPKSYLPMTRNTLDTFRLPDPMSDLRLPLQLEMIRRVSQELGDTVCVAGRIAAPFSALALLYGITDLFLTMREDPTLVQDNLSFFVQHQIAFGKAQIDAGADLLWLGDNVASGRFISPLDYSEFAAEPAGHVAADLVEKGAFVVYFASETQLEHLKKQVKIPGSVLGVGEGVNIAQMRKELPVQKCLMGNFDPKLLRDGTPEEVSEATALMMRENKPGGAYIFNTGEGIMRTTPPVNVEAMIRTARSMA